MVMARVTLAGRITIPAAIRKQLGLEPGTEVKIQVRENDILIRPSRMVGETCGASEDSLGEQDVRLGD